MIDWKELSNEIRQAMPDLKILDEEPLARHMSFRIGGPAAIFAQPATVDELSKLLRFLAARGISLRILGAGTNVLAPDEGLREVVICTKDALTGLCDLGGGKIEAFAGETLSKTAVFARNLSLTGLEFAHGIPGTVGGGIYMNAGAYGGEIKDVLTAVTFLDENLHLQTLPVQELQMGYRTSIFERCSWCILEAEFTLHPGDAQEIHTAMQEYMRRRKEKQPLEYPSAGSTFKRPVGQFAGKLIEDCGLRGFRVGGAAISEKHCGFVVNLGNATCADVVSLTEQVRQIVLEKTGCTLEREIRVVE